MARRNIPFIPGHYYHIYNRGANHEDIFRLEENYYFLLRRVKEQALEQSISIIAYCFMPNHYHFLLRQDTERTISEFLQRVFNSYSKAFNHAFNRTGTLFEGPFKAIRVDTTPYLLHLCRYIHRNPVDAGLVTNPVDWMFSNYPEWLQVRAGSLVDMSFVREHFPKPCDYEQFVMEYQPPRKLLAKVKELSFE